MYPASIKGRMSMPELLSYEARGLESMQELSSSWSAEKSLATGGRQFRFLDTSSRKHFCQASMQMY